MDKNELKNLNEIKSVLERMEKIFYDVEMVYEYIYCSSCNIFMKAVYLGGPHRNGHDDCIQECPKCGRIIKFDKYDLLTFTEVEVAKLALQGKWYDG
jgi:hypothetical protein